MKTNSILPVCLLPENLLKDTKYLLDNVECIHSYDINCADMPDPKMFHAGDRLKDYFGEIFSVLDTITKNNVVYWFEAPDRESAEKYMNALNNYRKNEKRLTEYKRKGVLTSMLRVLPVENNNQQKYPDSKVLYVGKSEAGYTKKYNLSDVSGRMIVHFGYYDIPSTQGLQLYYWAKEIGAQLKLNVAQFPEVIPDSKIQTKEYLGILEKLYATNLHPLCGKH